MFSNILSSECNVIKTTMYDSTVSTPDRLFSNYMVSMDARGAKSEVGESSNAGARISTIEDTVSRSVRARHR
jgi:hypothetical protein